MESYRVLSFFDEFYNNQEAPYVLYSCLVIKKKADGSYIVTKDGYRLFFPVQIGIEWNEKMAEDLKMVACTEEDIQDVKKIMTELTLHLEVLKTTLREILQKLDDLSRHDQLIKYMKKVINMLKKDLVSFRSRLCSPYREHIANQVDALILPYEELKGYFREPGSKAKERLMAVIDSMFNKNIPSANYFRYW